MKKLGPRVTFGYAVRVVWPAQWLNLAASTIGIFTLGMYVPDWPLSYMFWAVKRYQRRHNKAKS